MLTHEEILNEILANQCTPDSQAEVPFRDRHVREDQEWMMLNPSKEEIRVEMRDMMYRNLLLARKSDGTFCLTIEEYAKAIRAISLKNE